MKIILDKNKNIYVTSPAVDITIMLLPLLHLSIHYYGNRLGTIDLKREELTYAKLTNRAEQCEHIPKAASLHVSWNAPKCKVQDQRVR